MINRQSASSRYRSPVEISIRSSSRGPDADKLEFLLAPGEGHFRWGRRSARLALYRERLLICAASPPAERSKGDLGGRVGENPAVRADALQTGASSRDAGRACLRHSVSPSKVARERSRGGLTAKIRAPVEVLSTANSCSRQGRLTIRRVPRR
jgi:hypothetical protein